MSKLNNFELDKFCPNCKKSLSLSTDNKYYYCSNGFDCRLNYYYYYNEDKILIYEFIKGYGWILLKNNKNEMIDNLGLYKYVLDEEHLTSSEIVEKYSEFKGNLIFL